jgi:hypothetical protein
MGYMLGDWDACGQNAKDWNGRGDARPADEEVADRQESRGAAGGRHGVLRIESDGVIVLVADESVLRAWVDWRGGIIGIINVERVEGQDDGGASDGRGIDEW